MTTTYSIGNMTHLPDFKIFQTCYIIRKHVWRGYCKILFGDKNWNIHFNYFENQVLKKYIHFLLKFKA